MIRATVITDASFCSKTLAAGWAAWVRVDGMTGPLRHAGQFGNVSPRNPTLAEVYAALNGIWIAAKLGRAQQVLIQSDYMAVIHLARGETRSPDLIKIWRESLSAHGLDEVMLLSRHVKGHTTINDARSFVNRWCDQQAKLHMKQGRKDHERRTR